MTFARPILTTALALSATLVGAQDYSSRYDVIGQYDLIVDGNAATAYTTFDKERNKSSVARREVFGNVFYNVTASIPAADGGTQTVISVQLRPDQINDIQYLQGGTFGADIPGGEMALDGAPAFGADGNLTFAFHGKLIAFAYTADGDFAPVEGGGTIEISGSYRGQYPLE